MKRLVLGVLLTAALALSIPAGASAAEEYEGFVGCDIGSSSPIPATTCAFESNPAAFFEADEPTTYDLCSVVPNGDVFCLNEERDVAAGVLDSIPLPRKEAGSYLFVWFVGEDPVAEWEFTLNAAVPPPPPPPAPPAPAPVVPVATGPSQGCLKAQKRVKQLKNKLQNVGKKQKAKVRTQLKGARTAAKKAC